MRGSQSHFYHYDGLGAVTRLTDPTGEVRQAYAYDAFGNLLNLREVVVNPYRFSTKEYSPASGLIYFGARYYDPKLGRFLTQDPLGMIDGPNRYIYVGSVGKVLPYFKPINETNPYLYTGNNPVTRIDPLGLWYIDVNFGVGWWGAVGTGGVIFSDKGIYSYGGGGGGTPGPAFGLTWSPFDPTPGWNFGLQGGWWVGGQVGTDIEGNRFWEVGVVAPGASVTGYYVEPFQWPWQKDTKQVCPEKKK